MLSRLGPVSPPIKPLVARYATPRFGETSQSVPSNKPNTSKGSLRSTMALILAVLGIGGNGAQFVVNQSQQAVLQAQSQAMVEKLATNETQALLLQKALDALQQEQATLRAQQTELASTSQQQDVTVNGLQQVVADQNATNQQQETVISGLQQSVTEQAEQVLAVRQSQESQKPVAVQFTEAQREVARKMQQATFYVSTADKKGSESKTIGSAGLIRVGNTLLLCTNEHVYTGVKGKSKAEKPFKLTMHDGTTFETRCLAVDKGLDLAFFAIPDDLAERFSKIALPAADITQPGWSASGTPMLACGNPSGLKFTITAGTGTVQHTPVHKPKVIDAPTYIQTDAALNPGNSGGMLVSLTGEVLGVPQSIGVEQVAIASSRKSQTFDIPKNSTGFAVPIDLVVASAAQHGLYKPTPAEVTQIQTYLDARPQYNTRRNLAELMAPLADPADWKKWTDKADDNHDLNDTLAHIYKVHIVGDRAAFKAQFGVDTALLQQDTLSPEQSQSLTPMVKHLMDDHCIVLKKEKPPEDKTASVTVTP